MKKILIIFLFILSLPTIAGFYFLPQKIQTDIENHLKNLGFKEIIIEKTSVGLTSIHTQNIKLDKDGFSTIKSLKARLFWPSYLVKKEIESVTINELVLTSLADDIDGLLLHRKKEEDLDKFFKEPINKLTIEKIIWDIATSQGAFRLEGSLAVQDKEQQKDIRASLQATQKQLTLDSQWAGTWNANNNLQLNGTIESLKLHHSPIKIGRANGWISYNNKDNTHNISGQLDAGSGMIFNIPINDIGLVIGQEKDSFPILFRAQASGVKDATLSIDMRATPDPQQADFSASLNIADTREFLNYLKNQDIKKDIVPENYKEMGHTNIQLTYMPTRRFADGPIPFDMRIIQDSKENLKGTFLIYPDSLDIRGTAETKEEILNLLKLLLSIPDKNISENVIRLEGNLGNFLNRFDTDQ